MLATKFGNVRVEDGTFLGINGQPDYVRRACDGHCSGSGWTRSISTTSIASTPTCRLKRRSARWPSSSRRERFGTSDCPRPHRNDSAGPGDAPDRRGPDRVLAMDSRPEEGVLETCRALGIGFVAYSPLGRGFLTGRFRSIDDLARTTGAATTRVSRERISRRTSSSSPGSKRSSKKKGCTPAQLAIAWLLSRGDEWCRSRIDATGAARGKCRAVAVSLDRRRCARARGGRRYRCWRTLS